MKEWDIICASDSRSGNIDPETHTIFSKGWVRMISKELGEWFYYRGAPHFDIIG